MSQQTTLNLTSPEADGPVECLGHTFPSDAARREHYLGMLAEKLQDPEFRKIEGFPIGEDEDILALSDPPYYTACPNPWIGQFIEHYGRPYDPKENYHREPFVADVSEGKGHAIYKAHSYHTKVPHRAIMRYILHYTEPGDVVFDGFCGTGMTGVAAELCSDTEETKALGLRLSHDDLLIGAAGSSFSKLGARIALLSDLSPIATFISYNYNYAIDPTIFEREATRILDEIENEIGWMYETTHTDGKTKARIEFTVWSEMFICPECASEIDFFKESFEVATKRVKDRISCPSCGVLLGKKNLVKSSQSFYDQNLGRIIHGPKRSPALIHYKIGKKSYEKYPDPNDIESLDRIRELLSSSCIPCVRMMFAPDEVDSWGDKWRAGTANFSHTNQVFVPRAAIALSLLWEKARMVKDTRVRAFLLFTFEQSIWAFSMMNRYRPAGFSQVGQYMSGVYYIASQHAECSPWYILRGKVDRISKAAFWKNEKRSFLNTGSATNVRIPDNSVDYIFTDPPFGDNLAYAELNFLVEAFHRVFTNNITEAVISGSQKKGLGEYRNLVKKSLSEFHRVLKPGRWMTVEFSNTSAAVWNSIQTALTEVGFVIANVSALDKQQGSFNAVSNPTSVKQDLVISAYKPNGGLEERFLKSGHTPEGVWDFIKTHLRNLPVVKPRGGELEFVTERDPRILYDRMVAFYVGHGVPVPLSSAEFQAGLAEKFPEREGMAFLPEQVAEFDKKHAQMQGVGQMSIFVEDEKSAIDWLRNFLKSRPSVTSDITPEFMQQLGASWKKFETRPELALLLEQNFLQYRGDGEVPGQIHSYLSTQNKDLRNLPKDDARLRSRAKDRWYVPDPAKAVDVESIRNKRLLQEFRQLCDEAGVRLPSPGVTNQTQLPLVLPVAKKTARKKLQEVRTEAVRLGFKECFAAKDYVTILALAAHLPNNVIEEDEQLQMIFDMAEMRAGG